MTCGVYTITNRISSKVYVGSSVSLRGRKWRHWRDLINNCHPNQHLQRSWDKHGEGVFVFEVVKRCHPSKRLVYEQFYIDFLLKSGVTLYNSHLKAGSPEGWRHSEESKKKISDAHTGKRMSEEAKAKMRGKREWSEESRQRIVASNKARTGEKWSAEARKKFSERLKKELATNPGYREKLRQNVVKAQQVAHAKARAGIITEAQRQARSRNIRVALAARHK